jgi:gas vesicle protein
MSKSTRIIAAFAIGATAGALLGLLLHPSSDVKSLTKENNKDQLSFLDRLVGTKERSTKNFEAASKNAGEYEQA